MYGTDLYVYGFVRVAYAYVLNHRLRFLKEHDLQLKGRRRGKKAIQNTFDLVFIFTFL